MAGQPGFFDTDARLRALSAAGDPLERLGAVMDFELFRPDLEAALARADRSRGGRPMAPQIARGNATRARVRAHVEHVFATEKHRMRLLIRTIGLVWETAKITRANLNYNMRRLVWIEGRTASA